MSLTLLVSFWVVLTDHVWMVLRRMLPKSKTLSYDQMISPSPPLDHHRPRGCSPFHSPPPPPPPTPLLGKAQNLPAMGGGAPPPPRLPLRKNPKSFPYGE